MKLELSKEHLYSIDPVAWLERLKLLNEFSRPIEFDNRPWARQIIKDQSRKLVVKKSTQIGFSTAAMLKALWEMRFRGYNIIYTLPNDSDLPPFVRTKFDQIIDINPQLNANKSKGKDANTVSLKQYYDRSLFFEEPTVESKLYLLLRTATTTTRWMIPIRKSSRCTPIDLITPSSEGSAGLETRVRRGHSFIGGGNRVTRSTGM